MNNNNNNNTNINTNTNTINNIINNYFIFGRKLNNILNNKIAPCKKFMNITQNNNSNDSNISNISNISNVYDIVDLIEVNVAFLNFKIISLTVYFIPPNVINYNVLDYKTCVLQYVNNIENRTKISKYNIKIIEDDKGFIITDTQYNMYNVNNIITSTPNYLHSTSSIKSLLKNILE